MSVVAVACVLGAVTGIFIGMTSIGGPVFVPGLVILGGIPIQDAIAAAMASFFVSGCVGSLANAKRGARHWPLSIWLWTGAIPGTIAGALVGRILPQTFVELAVASLVVGAGLQPLISRPGRPRADAAQRETLAGITLVILGLVIGFASPITGTGGPILLLPILMMLRMAPHLAVVMSQAVMMPIGGFATASFLLRGDFPWPAVLALSAGVVAGTIVGTRLAARMNAPLLRRFLSYFLLLLGVFMIGRVADTLLFSN